MTELEQNIKDYLLERKREAEERIRQYQSDEPSTIDEVADYGHAMGQLEIIQNMLRELFKEE